MLAPQDQRGSYDSSQQQAVVSGERVGCEVEGATDLDTLTPVNGTPGESPDDVNYKWEAERSGDQSSDKGSWEWQVWENGQLVTKTGPTAPTTQAVWVAPPDVTKDTQFTLKCTLDDKPLAINSPAEGGKRDDDQLVRSVSLKGQEFQVTFEGLARACAGGIGVDGVHSFSLTGTAKKVDGSIAPGTGFKLSFDGNKGHDYSSDDPSIQPVGWTPDQIKKAKFVTTDANGNRKLVEEMNVTTDDKGQFSLTVLSSDIVSSDIKVKVKWTNPSGVDADAGQQSCDFAEAVAKRRFPNQNDPADAYPSDDNGWLFSQQWLNSPGAQTTAKMYLKFMKDPSKGDINGNWSYVTGHRMFFQIGDVNLKEDAQRASSNDSYATVVPTQQDVGIYSTVAADGAATAIIQAGDSIDDADTITVEVHDESQWDT